MLRSMKSVKCRTTRAAIETYADASAIAARVRKGAESQLCPYCGWWHVAGYGSAIERPSKPRKRR